jgi:hypothetical protein
MWKSRNSKRLKISFEKVGGNDGDIDGVNMNGMGLGKVLEYKSSATESPSYNDLKEHQSWYVEECSKILDQTMQAKLQWLQNRKSNN